jgi:hypothetical protein
MKALMLLYMPLLGRALLFFDDFSSLAGWKSDGLFMLDHQITGSQGPIDGQGLYTIKKQSESNYTISKALPSVFSSEGKEFVL